MKKYAIYAFADEAGADMDTQIQAMVRNGLDGLEIRGVDGTNVSDISREKAREVRKKLDDNGLQVWSVGSPIGKIGITDPMEPHLERLRHTMEIGNILGAVNLRMFSFYVPGEAQEQYRQAVMDRVGAMLEAAQGSGIALCHENEKGIYGSTPARCLELHQAFPALKAVFDPANFIQCGVETWGAWELLRGYVRYLHIKDATPQGAVVPAGCGMGHLSEIISDFRFRGGVSMTVEPHLQVFPGRETLERTAVPDGVYWYPSSEAAFDAACDALRKLV